MAKVKTLSKPQSFVVNKSHNQKPKTPERPLGELEYLPTDQLHPHTNNPRDHSPKQLQKLGKIILKNGFMMPILIDSKNNIISGHARLIAAKNLGMPEVPTLRIEHLDDDEIRAFRIADNRIAEDGEWNFAALALELEELVSIDFDLSLTGFEIPEIDIIIQDQLQSVDQAPEEEIPPPDLDKPPVSEIGDFWLLGQHRIICGDAREESVYSHLMRGTMAVLVITDPPYNVKVNGHIRVSDKAGHDEFAMASGEMPFVEFSDFLRSSFTNTIDYSQDGSLHYIFMDWRHLQQLQTVCDQLYSEQINLCIWVKSNGGMGSFYRSQHELVVVYKKGAGKHRNNIQLGMHGRNRTNVWEYAGANSFGPDRRESLDLHPTVKPVEMIADAILDASAPGDIILDPFLGSGTLLIAAEKTDRIGRGMELDPRYVDVSIRRWQEYTGKQARHAETGMTFDEIEQHGRPEIKLLSPPATFEPSGGQSHD